nr:very short patch repair endonuclease [Nitrosomonas nitrosa]
MALVRGKGNKATELAVVSLFRRHHVKGWRRHVRLFGKPDFIFRKQRLAVFVDGCFWHGCPMHSSQPTSNRTFWEKKLKRNKERDRIVTKTLRKSGWRVLRIWQHELTRRKEGPCVNRIRRALGPSSL